MLLRSMCWKQIHDVGCFELLWVRILWHSHSIFVENVFLIYLILWRTRTTTVTYILKNEQLLSWAQEPGYHACEIKLTVQNGSVAVCRGKQSWWCEGFSNPVYQVGVRSKASDKYNLVRLFPSAFNDFCCLLDNFFGHSVIHWLHQCSVQWKPKCVATIVIHPPSTALHHDHGLDVLSKLEKQWCRLDCEKHNLI